MRHSSKRIRRLAVTSFLACAVKVTVSLTVSATDYYVTIGGGYNPSGNQASLEANVLFFRQVLKDQHPGPWQHEIYFADGRDPDADLQVLAEKKVVAAPATELLGALHRRRGQTAVTYRNHRVTEIAGPLEPALIRAGLETLAKTAHRGDRLIVYVTAHGSAGPRNDSFNTTIDCWNEKQITAREFAGWIGKFPSDVPVVMVMAQCYCGGFAHTIFQELNDQKGLAPQLRAGFFAQQHDLPAAGCRPDIEHDEEFSSYFWGALAGRSRNGVPIMGCDIDANGEISFAEAYAYAVTAGETIDIPLRTSEVVLRRYSSLKEPEGNQEKLPTFATMNGTLQSFVDRGRPVSGRIVTQLSKALEFTLQDDVSVVLKTFRELGNSNRPQNRGRGPRGSGRRNLLREVAEKWPELGDEERWEKSPLLRPENQAQLLAELQQLPAWKNYDERRKQNEKNIQAAERHELRTVKFQRLINVLEEIVLEQNLPHTADAEVIDHYRRLIVLEESSLGPIPSRP